MNTEFPYANLSLMSKTPDMDIKEIAKAFGRLGGVATKKKYGNEHFKELSKKAVKARLEKGQIKKIQG